MKNIEWRENGDYAETDWFVYSKGTDCNSVPYQEIEFESWQNLPFILSIRKYPKSTTMSVEDYRGDCSDEWDPYVASPALIIRAPHELFLEAVKSGGFSRLCNKFDMVEDEQYTKAAAQAFIDLMK